MLIYAAFQPDCSGVGQEGTGTFKVRLDHTNGKYVFYSVDVLVDWDVSVENYARVPNIPINEDFTFDVAFTYSTSGTYNTEGRVNVVLTLDEQPNGVQFVSDGKEIIVGNGFCEAGITNSPTPSPTLSIPPTSYPTITPLPTISSANSSFGYLRTTGLLLAVGQLLLLTNAVFD